MLTISSTIRRTQTPDGGILLDIERGEMFSLNAIGSQILDLIEAGCDERRIADEVSATYGAEIETVRPDIRDFLAALGRQRILLESAQAVPSGNEAADGSTRTA
jgi:hypothetical protein